MTGSEISLFQEFLGDGMTKIVLLAVAIGLAMVALALGLPRVLNAYKSESINGDVLSRLAKLEKRTEVQDKKIHKYAIRQTRLTVAMIKMESLLIAHNIEIPPDLGEELKRIKEEEDEEIKED